MYDLPADGSGKRRERPETVKGAQRDAERVLRERLAGLENGLYVARQKETRWGQHRVGSTPAFGTTFLASKLTSVGLPRSAQSPK